jgi:diguanylate cyclase (GGDEF)-like protein/PAS domain S-box-containing protein
VPEPATRRKATRRPTRRSRPPTVAALAEAPATDLATPALADALVVAQQELAASEARFRRTEAALQATQERLERVLSSSPTVLYALFVEGDSLGLTWVSRNMPALLGYSVDDAMAPAWWEKNLHPEDRASASAGVARLFAAGHLTHEYRLRHKEGAWIWLRDDMRLRRDAKGRPVEIFGSWADITERREAEQVLKRDKAELEARVDARTSELRAANAQLQVELAERQRAEEASRQSEERLQIVAQATNDAIWDWDLASDRVWWNQGVQTLFGYSPAQVGPDAAWMVEQFHPQDRARVQQSFDALFADSGHSWSIEYRFRRADGTFASVLDRGHVLRDETGRPLRLIGAILDITERRRAEEALHDANDKLQAWVAELEQRNSEMALLGEMGELLQTCTTADEAYEVVAHSALQLFRDDSGALYVFRNSRNIVERAASWGDVPPQDHGFEPDECWALRRGRLHVVESTGGLRCPHAQDQATIGSLCIPMMAQGEALGILHLCCSADTLTESRRRFAQTVAENLALGLANLRLREALRSQAIRDPLTGLFNRRFMEEALEREMRRAVRRVSPLAVLMLDLDHFKQLNDSLGHDAGDALLRELGLFLQNHVRSADIACRYGGEEIMLILPDATLAHARQRAEELREGVSALVIQDRGRTIGPVTVSIGVAAYPDHAESSDMLVRAADAALYAAKAAGRDRVIVAS